MPYKAACAENASPFTGAIHYCQPSSSCGKLEADLNDPDPNPNDLNAREYRKTGQRVGRAKRKAVVRPTEFAYPRGINSCDLRFSRKGCKLADAMRAHAKSRLLPKLQARTGARPECNRYDDLSVEFMDACVYLHAWLGYGDVPGIVEFPLI
jgi:hypothetical protein